MQTVPTPVAGRSVKIALGHVARFRSYHERGQREHLIYSHNLSWRRIALANPEERAAVHESLHWQLGERAHV